MTDLHLYHCPTAPESRRWIAQYPRIKDNLYLVIHGRTAEQAKAKAELFQEFHALDLPGRSKFGLKERLAALNDGMPENSDEADLL